MAVYSIVFDIERFPILQEKALELSMQATTGELADFDGKPKLGDWQPVDLEWLVDGQDAKQGLPDITLWRAGLYACNGKVKSALSDLLGNDAEFLPLWVGDTPWFAIHILTTVDAIDKQYTELNYRTNGQPSRTRRFKRLVLKEEAFKDTKICHVTGAGLATFCGELFKLKVENNGIKGLAFKECETSENGYM